MKDSDQSKKSGQTKDSNLWKVKIYIPIILSAISLVLGFIFTKNVTFSDFTNAIAIFLSIIALIFTIMQSLQKSSNNDICLKLEELIEVLKNNRGT